MKTFQARQGDIWIESIANLPKLLKKQKSDVIAMGDSTNLAHRLIKGQILLDRKGNMYLSVPKTQIIHDHVKGHGHNPINLPKGFYKIIHQREIVFGDLIRIVQD
mgnify:CR=1 FL=1